MSTADDRRTTQVARDRDDERAQNERPMQSPIVPDPGRGAWSSYCAGWRGQYHEKAHVTADGSWVCRWCRQAFAPPSAEDAQRVRARAADVEFPARLGGRRRHW